MVTTGYEATHPHSSNFSGANLDSIGKYVRLEIVVTAGMGAGAVGTYS